MSTVELTLDNGQKCEISYYERKTGKNPRNNIILLHGLNSSAKVMDLALGASLEREAKEQNEAMHIFCIDLPGHGESEKRLKKFSTDVVAEVIYKFMKKMGINYAHLYGESTGGSACIKFAAKYPVRTRSLALQGAPIDGDDWGKLARKLHRPLLSPRHLLKMLNLHSLSFFNKIPRAVVHLALHVINPNTDEDAVIRAFEKIEGMKEATFEAPRKASLAATLDYMHDIVNMNLYPQLEEIAKTNIPVFLVDGEDPEHIGVDTLYRISGVIPRAYTLIIDGEGHLATILKSRTIANKLLNFIKNGS